LLKNAELFLLCCYPWKI